MTSEKEIIEANYNYRVKVNEFLEELSKRTIELGEEIINLRNATFESLDDIHKDLELLINERQARINKEREANESFRKME